MVGCDHLFEEEVTLVPVRLQTPATKIPECLLGSGKALTDGLPSSAWGSGVPARDSPGGARAFSEQP